MSERVNNAIERINKIKWDNIKSSGRASNGVLVREYLRRATLFIHSVGVMVKYPFFNAAKAIGKEPITDIVKVCPLIEKLDNALYKGLCQSYIEWSALADEGEPTAIEYQDLYEPLIKLFERGGGRFSIHHGELIIDSAAYPLNYWYNNVSAEPMDISDSALDNYDHGQ